MWQLVSKTFRANWLLTRAHKKKANKQSKAGNLSACLVLYYRLLNGNYSRESVNRML